MTNEELARRLDELRVQLVFPPTPELAPGVLRRLETPRPRRRRALVLALAALVVAAAAVLAGSPRARSAVLDWLDIGGVQIVRVDELPVVPLRSKPYWGEPVSLAEARRSADFPVRLPELDGFERPDAVYFKDYPAGGMVTLLYGSPAEPRVVLSSWLGRGVEPVILKVLPRGLRHDLVDVNGSQGLWLRGAPHAVVLLDRHGEDFGEQLYLAGRVVLWERGSRAFRLELGTGRGDALEVARSVR